MLAYFMMVYYIDIYLDIQGLGERVAAKMMQQIRIWFKMSK